MLCRDMSPRTRGGGIRGRPLVRGRGMGGRGRGPERKDSVDNDNHSKRATI